ncbi:regulator protein [Rhizobium sp. Pop5]|nr:regulator protein [Rhizobium sp. Pop5]
MPPVVEMPPPPVHRGDMADIDSLIDGPAAGETRAPEVVMRRGDDSSLDNVHASNADHLAAAPVGEERLQRGQRATDMDFRPERAAGRRKPRKFFSRLLVWCVLLAFIGIGAWWAHTSGLLLTAAERDTSVANPPARTQPEDFTGNGAKSDGAANTGSHTDEPVTIDPQNSFSADWIPVFKPEEADKIQNGARARTEKITENDGPAVRLISESGAADGNISISVPASVLQQLAGKSSTIALTLQSTTDEPTQVTVECNFQSLGNCARHRFSVTREKSDALLQVKFDRSLAPNSPGTLTINSDLDGKARGINLFAIRILPGQ